MWLTAPYTEATEDHQMRIKIEFNTWERETVLEPQRVPFAVDSPWFAGEGAILSLALEELVSTKLRSLFQRDKGRDLFDLWAAITLEDTDGPLVTRCFDASNRPDGFTVDRLNALLDERVASGSFERGLRPLVVEWPPIDYRPAETVELVRDEVLTHLS